MPGIPTLRMAAGLLLAAIALSACGGGPGRLPDGTERSPASPCTGAGAVRQRARAFLHHYERQGRVVRTDQGGDTVSEGQAYGLLLAELAGDGPALRSIWSWTAAHLLRPDGLLSWHWANGAVTGSASAADADLLGAWALLRWRGGDAASLNAAGNRLGQSVLRNETARLPNGQLVLVAGSWALRPTVTVDPSYWALPAFADLAALTGNRAWDRLETGTLGAASQVTRGGSLLPPDWARLLGTALSPIAAPSGSAGTSPQYGPDAQRLVVWAAAASRPARGLAAHWWGILGSGPGSAAQALGLQGRVITSSPFPLAAMAASAAAYAAGDHRAQARLCAEGLRLARQHPTYYGDAWSVLAPALMGGELR